MVLHSHDISLIAQKLFQHLNGVAVGHFNWHSSRLAAQRPSCWGIPVVDVVAAHRIGYALGHGHGVPVAAQERSQHLTLPSEQFLAQTLNSETQMPLSHRIGFVGGHGHVKRLVAHVESQHCAWSDEQRTHRSKEAAHVPVIGQTMGSVSGHAEAHQLVVESLTVLVRTWQRGMAALQRFMSVMFMHGVL